MTLDSLDHDDGVIHDQTDGQDQAEERKRVERKTEHGEEYKGADEGNRNGQKRNQGSSPTLQENVDHEDYKNERDDKGFDNFLDAFGHRAGLVQSDAVVHVLRETLLHGIHQLAHSGRGVHRVRSGQLIHGDDRAWLAVHAARDAVVLRAQLDASYVFHAHEAIHRRLTDDDFPELLRRNQAALRENGIREFLPFRRWLAAGFSRGVHCVLRLNGRHHIGHGNSQFRKLVRLYPQPHRILAGSEYLHVPNTGQAGERIIEVDISVIGKESRVIGAVRRVESEQHKRGRH